MISKNNALKAEKNAKAMKLLRNEELSSVSNSLDLQGKVGTASIVRGKTTYGSKTVDPYLIRSMNDRALMLKGAVAQTNMLNIMKEQSAAPSGLLRIAAPSGAPQGPAIQNQAPEAKMLFDMNNIEQGRVLTEKEQQQLIELIVPMLQQQTKNKVFNEKDFANFVPKFRGIAMNVLGVDDETLKKLTKETGFYKKALNHNNSTIQKAIDKPKQEQKQEQNPARISEAVRRDDVIPQPPLATLTRLTEAVQRELRRDDSSLMKEMMNIKLKPKGETKIKERELTAQEKADKKIELTVQNHLKKIEERRKLLEGDEKDKWDDEPNKISGSGIRALLRKRRKVARVVKK